MIALAIPVTAIVVVSLIQLALLKFGIIPNEANKLTSSDMFLIIVIQAATFVIISFALIRSLKFEFFRLGDEVSAKDLLLGFAGLLGVNLVSSLFLHLIGTQPEQFKEFNRELLQSNIYLFMFTVAFMGPIYEEFIFRGVILGLLCFRESSALKIIPAVIFSSALFMAAHFDDMAENIFIGFPLFLLGLYFSFWTLRKKGFMLTIILHMTQNLLAGLAMLYATNPAT